MSPGTIFNWGDLIREISIWKKGLSLAKKYYQKNFSFKMVTAIYLTIMPG